MLLAWLIITLLRVPGLGLGPVMSHAQSTPPAPSPDEQSQRLSESEYADLKAYVNRAQQVLEDTLASAQHQGGAQLHATLLSGIQASLEEARPGTGLLDLRQELLLFRSVLVRAIELDGVFKNDQGIAANVVLLAGIHSALHYYNVDDKARLSSPIVPQPDWVGFAATQIPVLIKMSSLSPSNETSLEVIKRTVGWTAIDLNRSVLRRDHAKAIVGLETMLKSLEKGLATPGEGMELLSHVLATVAKTTSTASYEFPSEDYPGVSTRKPAPLPEGTPDPNAIFPLVGKKLPLTGALLKLQGSDRETRGAYTAWNVEASLGAGGIAVIADQGDNKGFGAVSAAAHALIFHSEGMAANYWHAKGDAAFTGMSGGGTEGGAGYSARANANAGGFWLAGAWVGIEANDYARIRETITRVGWNVSVPLSLGEKDYVLVRLGVGVGTFFKGPGSADGATLTSGNNAGLSFEAQVLLHVSRFVLNIQADHDASQQLADVKRTSLYAALSLSLGAIFPNDAVRIEGQMIQYDLTDPFNNQTKITAARVGGFYEVRF